MENLLIVLGVLTIAIVVILPLVERFSSPIDPMDEEQQQKLTQKAKIMRFLMMFLMIWISLT